MTSKKFLLQEINKRILRIEERNPNYMNSKKWKYYKAIEDKLYNEINSENNEKSL